MICGASIAKRDGTHRPCLLDAAHSGDCSPLALVGPPRPRPPAARELAWFAIAHVLAVLAIVVGVGILSLGSGAP